MAVGPSIFNQALDKVASELLVKLLHRAELNDNQFLHNGVLSLDLLEAVQLKAKAVGFEGLEYEYQGRGWGVFTTLGNPFFAHKEVRLNAVIFLIDRMLIQLAEDYTGGPVTVLVRNAVGLENEIIAHYVNDGEDSWSGAKWIPNTHIEPELELTR